MKKSNPKKDLFEAVKKLIEEALSEAGPLGYLSKTSRPDAKTGWNPDAQKKWAQDKEAEMGISSAGKSPTGTASPVKSGSVQQNSMASQGRAADQSGQAETPPAQQGSDDKTNVGALRARRQQQQEPVAPPQTGGSGQSLADVSSMLSGASAEQLSQILSILERN